MKLLLTGAGAMGLPMALALHDNGFNVHCFDTMPSDALKECDLPFVEDPKDIIADVVLIVVRDDAEVNAVCFDDQALFATPEHSYPRTCILSSTVSVASVMKLRERLPDDVALIDALMSGAPLAASNRSLSFMLGGTANDINRMMPLFKAMGTHQFHLGPLGHGMQVKTLNNTVAAATVVAVRRVLADAIREGVDTRKLLEVLSASSGATWYGDHFDDISWARETYAKSNTIGILEKDVQCALDGLSRDVDEYDRVLLECLRTLPPLES